MEGSGMELREVQDTTGVLLKARLSEPAVRLSGQGASPNGVTARCVSSRRFVPQRPSISGARFHQRLAQHDVAGGTYRGLWEGILEEALRRSGFTVLRTVEDKTFDTLRYLLDMLEWSKES